MVEPPKVYKDDSNLLIPSISEIKYTNDMIVADNPLIDQNFDFEYQLANPFEEMSKSLPKTYFPEVEPQKLHENLIVNFFLQRGLTEAQAKGIYGNIMQESGGKIDIISKDGHNSYGIALWTGPRKLKLFKMFGTAPTLEELLEFLWWELNNTHLKALDKLLTTTTIYDATKVFMNEFERPHRDYANFAKRIKYATSI